MGDADLRAGDPERERATRALREHLLQGRIDLDEFDARLSRVYAAATRGQLAELFADLPASETPSRAEGAMLWWPGVTSFHIERRMHAPPSAVYEDALRQMVPRMAMAGFDLYDDVAPRRLLFRWEDLSVGVILHEAPDGGTLVSAFGRAPRKIRKAFANLRD